MSLKSTLLLALVGSVLLVGCNKEPEGATLPPRPAGAAASGHGGGQGSATTDFSP